MTTAEYLRELRSDRAIVLLTKWLYRNRDYDIHPTVDHELEVETVISYRRFFLFPTSKLVQMTIIHHFWELPDSGGDLMIAQNLHVAIRTAKGRENHGEKPLFENGEWTFHAPDDDRIPLAVLDRIIAVLEPMF